MKVSALIPTYNRRAYIFRAIDSVIAQTSPVDEIIVVDDGSTDATAESIRSRYGPRVAVFTQKNMGVSAARRRAIEEAHGEWVAFLDSDDEWTPDRNTSLLNAAATLPTTVAWIFGNTEFVADDGVAGTVFGENGLEIDRSPRLINHPLSELAWDPRRPRVCVIPSSVIRRTALLELDCFSEGFSHAEDFLASLQVASRFAFGAIPDVVTRVYRTSDLKQSSLEYNMGSSGDRYKAIHAAYSLVAQTAGTEPWGRLHADSVRALCKWRAQEGLSIRRLALEQFRFGVSTKSAVFFGAAMLGSGFFRAGSAVKRRIKALRQERPAVASPQT